MNENNHNKREKSIVDALFILVTFGVLMICALFIVLFGARVYKKTAHDMNLNFTSRTALAYVSEKMHQHDRHGCVDVMIDDGHPVLKLTQYINSDEYCTYLYSHEGYLKELTAKGDIGLIRNAGKNIIRLNDFTAARINSSLYRFNITDEEGNRTEFFVSLYSTQDEDTGSKGGSIE